MLHVGIAGHRNLGDSSAPRFVAQQCYAILKQLQIQYTDVTAHSAVAEGTDTLFAEAALTLAIPLDIVRPFEEYALDFASSNALKRYYRLRAAARTETKLGYLGRSNEAYLAAMKWVVAHSDVLVAAWDGLPPVDVGGTGDAVNQAILRHRAWVHLNVIDQSVSFHSLDILGNGLDRKSL